MRSSIWILIVFWDIVVVFTLATVAFDVATKKNERKDK